jgi:putative membrane protein
MQGVTPALLIVEWLIRRSELTNMKIIKATAVCGGLAFSAFYEILEWLWVILFYPDSGPEWLGMQGDPWDAQGDMFMALCGALVAVTVLSAFHRRSLDMQVKLDSAAG